MSITTVRGAPTRKPRRRKPKPAVPDFGQFDAAPFMTLRTPGGFVITNTAAAMARRGHLPGEVARRLFYEFGITVSGIPSSAPERGLAALAFFAGLIRDPDGNSLLTAEVRGRA